MTKGRLQSALEIHSKQIDQVIERFRNELNLLIAIAQAAVSHALITKLTLDDQKRVRRTPANVRLLRKLPTLWQQALQDAGLDSLLQRYISAFPAQVAAFRSVFDALNAEAKEKPPVPEFTKSDHRLFSSLALSAGAAVAAEVEIAAHGITPKLSLGLGVMTFPTLVDAIKEKTDVAKSFAETQANTSIHSFFRHVVANAFEKIERATGSTLKYRYRNPLDQATRPFCRDLLLSNQAYTRAEIDKMDNEQTPVGTVFFLGGGFNCRGSFWPSLF